MFKKFNQHIKFITCDILARLHAVNVVQSNINKYGCYSVLNDYSCSVIFTEIFN